MKETLTIKNFGPIKDITLELGKVNVLIGEQGTGKSVIAKILAICKDIKFLLECDSENELDIEFELDNYGIKEFAQNGKAVFKYTSSNVIINYDSGNENPIEINFLNSLQPLVKKFNKINSSKKSDFDKLMEAEENIISYFGRLIFVPTERSLIPLIQSKSFRFIENKIRIPKYVAEFGGVFQDCKDNAKEVELEFLKLKFQSKGKDDYVVYNNTSTILHHAASGFQSIVPVAIIVKSLTDVDNKNHFIIEEPEINLFPQTQNSLVRFLIERFDKKLDTLLLTTHSPYVLTSLNNLIYAYQVGQKNKTATKKIVDEKYWLNPDEVSAYYLSNGKAENIIDKELGLIKAEYIDAISTVINEEFGKLTDIEFSNK